MSLLNAIVATPITAAGNLPITYQGASDAVSAAQFALLKAGKAGTDGVLNGVVCRYGDYGVVNYFDQKGNAILRRASGNATFVDGGALGLIDHFGSAGGSKQALLSTNLGAPTAGTATAVHAAITSPAAASATGIHAATTLTTAQQIITTGITSPAGLMPTIVGNDTDMIGMPVVFNYTDLNGKSGNSLTLYTNGTTTVLPTLVQIPAGVNTIESITLPPYLVDSSETISVGTSGLVVVTGITNPDITRCLSITGGAALMSGSVSLLGVDYNSILLPSTIALSGTSTVAGLVAYKSVTAIYLPPKTNTTGDTVSVGVANALGLPYKMDHSGVYSAQFGTVKEATAPTVTYDGTNVSGNTITLASTYDGSKQVVVDFMRSDAPSDFNRL